MKKVFIVSFSRTPFGSFGGNLSSLSAVELGAISSRKSLEKIQIDPQFVNEIFLGNVISANLGQAPAKQVSIKSGIGENIPCTLINKVCASGMKSVMLGAQSIMLGLNDVVLAGGMESMSNIPYYIPKARFGYKFGNGELIDGLVRDGLWEPYHDFLMGNCAENTASEMNLTRQQQDEYAITSYQRAAEFQNGSIANDEIDAVEIKGRKGEMMLIDKDEEIDKVNFEKIPNLKSVFKKDGTVTAANASTLNDGAATMILMNEDKVKELKINPVAEIIAFSDAAQDPLWFTTSPSLAIPKLLKHANIKKQDIDLYEINEAFSAVALANMKILEIPHKKINVCGGAVSIGHPLGASGSRITMTLANILRHKNKKYGVASICNGGGGASAILLENVN